MSLILNKVFYNRNPLVVAQDLLGKVLIRRMDNNVLSGRIIEVEAYVALIDEAAHSYIGIKNKNKSLFGEPGTAYIYSIHTHCCFNAVCDEFNTPGGVLIRALEPLKGIDIMKTFRNKDSVKDLTSGPGKLCKSLNINKSFDGANITTNNSVIQIINDGYILDSINIIKTKRIGVTKSKDLEFRFFIKGNKFVSKSISTK